MKAIILLLLSVTLFSCSPQKRLTRLLHKHPELLRSFDKDTIIRDTILVRDTINLPADSGMFAAYIDSLNRTLQTIFDDSLLNIQARVDSVNPARIIYQYKIKERMVPYEKRVPYEKKIKIPCNCPGIPEHQYKWWELLPWWVGVIALIGLILFICRVAYKQNG